MKEFLRKSLNQMAPLIWEAKGYFANQEISSWTRRHPHEVNRAQQNRLKVAFVTTWFGRDISGGAESECWGLQRPI